MKSYTDIGRKMIGGPEHSLENTTRELLPNALVWLFKPHGPLVADLLDTDNTVLKTVPVEIRLNSAYKAIELLVSFPVDGTVYRIETILIRVGHDQPILQVGDIGVLVTPASPDYTILIPVLT